MCHFTQLDLPKSSLTSSSFPEISREALSPLPYSTDYAYSLFLCNIETHKHTRSLRLVQYTLTGLHRTLVYLMTHDSWLSTQIFRSEYMHFNEGSYTDISWLKTSRFKPQTPYTDQSKIMASFSMKDIHNCRKCWLRPMAEISELIAT